MELDEFVRQTIEKLITGVGAACRHAKENATHIGGGSTTRVEFDVAVTTTEGSEKKAGAGMTVAGIGLGGQGKTDLSNSCVSRIKFTVLVDLRRTEEYKGAY
jgi:hypothetical protein